MLHGMGQNASAWNDTITLLPKEITPVCPELSEFFIKGSCDYNKLYKAFCEYLEGYPEPLDLCGLSLGAVLALNYAVDFPQRISSLILIAPQYRMPKMLLKIQNIVFKFMSDSSFKSIGFTKKDFITLTNSMADIDLTGGLKKVTCPALILCGEKDKANKKAAAELAETLPNAQFSEIKKSDHEVNRDNPDALARVIVNWSSKVKKAEAGK